MITYEQIQKANEGLKAIDVKGKKYVMVNEKVKAFRMLFPEGFIRTELLSLENGVAVMQSRAGYYENGAERVLGTGLAFERQDSSFINKTSYIENCETSAIGRCLSFLSLGADDSIASAEELANAIMNQGKNEFPKQVNKVQDALPRTERTDPPAEVTTASAMPENPAAEYIHESISKIQKKMNLKTYNDAKQMFLAWVNKLVESGALDPIDWRSPTMDQAVNAFIAVNETFHPGEKK